MSTYNMSAIFVCLLIYLKYHRLEWPGARDTNGNIPDVWTFQYRLIAMISVITCVLSLIFETRLLSMYLLMQLYQRLISNISVVRSLNRKQNTCYGIKALLLCAVEGNLFISGTLTLLALGLRTADILDIPSYLFPLGMLVNSVYDTYKLHDIYAQYGELISNYKHFLIEAGSIIWLANVMVTISYL